MKTSRWVGAAIGGACLFITVVLILITKWGVHVRPIGLMKPSFFDQPSAIGVSVFERLYPDLETQETVVWGSQPGAAWYEEAAIGFIERAKETGLAFKVLYIDRDIPAPKFLEWAQASGITTELISFNNSEEHMADLAARLKRGQRPFIYTAGMHASSQLFGNAMSRFKLHLKLPAYAIIAAPLARNFGEEDKVEPRCVGLANDQQGTRDLGCFLMQASRSIYRKKNIPLDRYTAIMNQDPYSKDVVLQIAPPEGLLR